MGTSKNLHNRLVDFLIKKDILFRNFEHVYLFGSTVKGCSRPHDIDLLLTYSVYRDDIISNSDLISSLFEQEFAIPVDLTVLSREELERTHFLERINLYVVLK